MEYTLGKEGKELNILGATSGDTGSAAAYALKGKKGIRLFMLSPYGRMSRFQQRQMYTLNEPNIFNLVVNGTFDDCQTIVKEANADADFQKEVQTRRGELYQLGANLCAGCLLFLLVSAGGQKQFRKSCIRRAKR